MVGGTSLLLPVNNWEEFGRSLICDLSNFLCGGEERDWEWNPMMTPDV